MASEQKKQPGRGAYEWVQTLVCSVLAVVLVFTFAVRGFRVDGQSMRENLQDGDMLLVLSDGLCGDYQPGDIVILRKASFRDGKPIVKRVIAMAGQTVDIDFGAGIVYVDGEALEEDYIREPTWTPEGLNFPVTVPEGHIFVLGDNRNDSSDSRHKDLGPIDTRMVIGKAVFLVVPGVTVDLGTREWSRAGFLK
ncbi:signal peptidase I [Dysosmobacter sp.]|uniref:signal peptidase I n=1 Tax=Dysosmobacter sp. TaxID=2591382 RepID=UPI002A92D08D|nr:signal peptidase I [Dysosmobacter sp.]MDY5613348.1 signal peptidase I [Dysosmobacter sp.]